MGSEGMIGVTFFGNEGSGVPQEDRVAEGTTVQQFLAVKMGRRWDAAKYDVKVNREAVDLEAELGEGDLVSLHPKKITGYED